ncbi:MAG: DUF5655 domain-containing protein [Anaerolineae bacterium]
MARDSQRLEQEFIATCQAKTGRDLGEWMTVIAAAGLDKPNAILKWLKDEHKLNHMQANFLSGIFVNDGKPVFDYEVLFARLFEGKEALLPIYQALEQQVKAHLPDADFVPTKSYLSLEGKRVFGCATLTKSLIRVGLDLGDEPFGAYVQKAKSLGAMPNVTHMVEIAQPGDVSDTLVGYVERAYQRVHKG